jgi:hypothetical protein
MLPAAQNDGRVTRRKDYVPGEDVPYKYDSLGRLTQAMGTGVAWSQSFTHGFGNLTQRSGSGTPLSVTVNAKSQVAGGSYDANGNQTAIGTHGLGYDFENRLVSVRRLNAWPRARNHGPIMHELWHNLSGKDDGELEDLLGLPRGASGSIPGWMRNQCFTGKGSR